MYAMEYREAERHGTAWICHKNMECTEGKTKKKK